LAGKKYAWLVDFFINQSLWQVSQKVNFGPCSVVTSGYFSQSCSSISLNQSAHSPLTSNMNKAFTESAYSALGLFTNLKRIIFLV